MRVKQLFTKKCATSRLDALPTATLERRLKQHNALLWVMAGFYASLALIMALTDKATTSWLVPIITAGTIPVMTERDQVKRILKNRNNNNTHEDC